MNAWFNGDAISLESILVGMVSNIIFGFIDNAGMFFGASFMDEWFLMLPKAEDANVFAGYGNTYSDFMGIFIGTFFGTMIVDLTKVDSTPMWGDAVGVALGCLLGI